MIKVSVIISSYNCNRELKNTFYSISRQKTNFDFEVCYIDDCSYEDPKFIYDNFLRVKHKKGIRLKQHIGSLGNSKKFNNQHYTFKNSFSMLLDMVSSESKIIFLNHGDVIMTTNDTLQKMVDSLEPKKIKVPDVRTVFVPEDLYINYEDGIQKALIGFENKPLYQGHNRDSLAPTLLCLYKEDLYNLDYDISPHEVYLKIKMKEQGYEISRYDELVGIHQFHSSRPSIHFLNPNQALSWSAKYPEKEEY